MANEKQINDTIEVLSKVYGKEPGDMRGFYWALDCIPADTLQEQAQAWVKREKWMPAPSELRELCLQAEAERQKQDEPRRIRQRAYWLFDKYRNGEVTLEQFVDDRGVQWVYRQYGIFSALIESAD